MNLTFIFNGGLSKRYHTVDTIKAQDIAAHSFGVAWLCEVLTEGAATKNLIMAALAHDLAEHIVGDLPSPSKRALGQHFMNAFDVRENDELIAAGVGQYEYKLTKFEVRTLRLADMFEGMLFCLRERALGNQRIVVVYERFRAYILEKQPLFIQEQAVFDAINNRWKDIA